MEARIIAHTDGAASPNPGPGGYGATITGIPGRSGPLEISQGFRRTTNNRMEILAVIATLEVTPSNLPITIFSDSRYVVDAITKGWAKKWKARNWMRTKTERAINPDLWEKMLEFMANRSVQVVWVRGHSGNPGNERADALAVHARMGHDLPPDAGYEGAANSLTSAAG